MSSSDLSTRLQHMTDELVATAIGREHRQDAVEPGTGGPAGNARLTAWTGLVLLVLSLAELVTLLDVRGYLSWHVVLGTLLIPPAVLKTATTGWRIVRYYTGNRSYKEAGPPPMLLRVLGPLVVVSTLAVLGTGVALVLLGQDRSRTTIVSAAGQRLDMLSLHQASFAVWAVATGLHVLGRLVPSLQLTLVRGRAAVAVPGPMWRGLALVLAAAVAAVAAYLVLGAADSWRQDGGFRHGGDDGAPKPTLPISRG
jgi:hypothetical protein